MTCNGQKLEQPKYLSMVEGMDRQWYSHPVEYFTSVRMKSHKLQETTQWLLHI